MIRITLTALVLILSACSTASAEEPPRCVRVNFGAVIGNGHLCQMGNGDRCYILGQSISCLK